MRRFTSYRPSGSTAIAFVALFAALAGGAVALPGTNTVTSNDIKRGAVKSSDIGNSQVRAQDIRRGAVRSSDVRNDSLTGDDINEGSLGTVPNASNAGRAFNATNAVNAANASNSSTVAGQTLRRIDFRALSGAAARTIFAGAGLTIRADCLGGTLSVSAVNTSGGEDSAIRTYSVDTGGGANIDNVDENDADFDIGESFDILPTDSNDQLGHIVFSTPTGRQVTIDYQSDDAGGVGTFDCLFGGMAVVG